MRIKELESKVDLYKKEAIISAKYLLSIDMQDWGINRIPSAFRLHIWIMEEYNQYRYELWQKIQSRKK